MSLKHVLAGALIAYSSLALAQDMVPKAPRYSTLIKKGELYTGKKNDFKLGSIGGFVGDLFVKKQPKSQIISFKRIDYYGVTPSAPIMESLWVYADCFEPDIPVKNFFVSKIVSKNEVRIISQSHDHRYSLEMIAKGEEEDKSLVKVVFKCDNKVIPSDSAYHSNISYYIPLFNTYSDRIDRETSLSFAKARPSNNDPNFDVHADANIEWVKKNKIFTGYNQSSNLWDKQKVSFKITKQDPIFNNISKKYLKKK